MYKIKKSAKDFKEAVIEKKYEHTLTFSISEIEAHERSLEKFRVELEGMMQLETAKIHNIEQHHAWVKKMEPEKLSTAFLYFSSLQRVSEIYPKLKEVKKQIKEYKAEKKDIYKELGFSDEPTK